jgi:hypothetical protein
VPVPQVDYNLLPFIHAAGGLEQYLKYGTRFSEKIDPNSNPDPQDRRIPNLTHKDADSSKLNEILSNTKTNLFNENYAPKINEFRNLRNTVGIPDGFDPIRSSMKAPIPFTYDRLS